MNRRKNFEITGVHRHAMLLQYFGLSNIEIAKRVHKNVGTISTWINDSRYQKAYKEYSERLEPIMREELRKEIDQMVQDDMGRMDLMDRIWELEREIKRRDRKERKQQMGGLEKELKRKAQEDKIEAEVDEMAQISKREQEHEDLTAHLSKFLNCN